MSVTPGCSTFLTRTCTFVPILTPRASTQWLVALVSEEIDDETKHSSPKRAVESDHSRDHPDRAAVQLPERRSAERLWRGGGVIEPPPRFWARARPDLGAAAF